MSADTACVYRIAQSNGGVPNSTIPLQIQSEGCANCQILQSSGVKDTTCYNTDLGEKTCTISPQYQSN